MADDQLLGQLKSKYASVISAAPQLGIQLQNVNMDNGKLLIRGKAPNEHIKNELWNRIKAVDSGYADLVADISVDPSMPQPATTGGADRSGGAARKYTVKSGDTLSKIAQQYYGNASEYNKIFQANRDKLSDPDKIQAGQELVIP